MEYRNDLERAYKTYESPLIEEDLYHLYYSGYDAMITHRNARKDAEAICNIPAPPVDNISEEEETEDLGEVVRYGDAQAEIDFDCS